MTDNEIREDFQRFIRHEAMRANCSQDKVIRVLNLPLDLQTLKQQ